MTNRFPRIFFKNFNFLKHFKNGNVSMKQVLFRPYLPIIRYSVLKNIESLKVNLKPRKVIVGSIGLAMGLYLNYPMVKASNLQLNKVIEEADELYENLEFKELAQLLSSYRGSKNADILWRLARALYEKSRREESAKKEYLGEALVLLKEAESLDANNFAIHKWLAIIMDCYYSLEGTKSRISHLFEMKSHMERACELKPKDGTSWHVLGLWYYGIADISWYERKAASVFFESPPQATYEEALNIFMKAEEVEPNFYSKNFLIIGKCLYNLRRYDESKIYFIKARDYPQKTLDDRETRYQAEKWLKSL